MLYCVHGRKTHKGEKMYTSINFKTKKELVTAFKAGQQIKCYQPGGLFESQRDGSVCLEGPHYPQPHKWYVQATLKDGIIIKIK